MSPGAARRLSRPSTRWVAALLLVAGLGLAAALPGVRWRLRILVSYTVGGIPDLDPADLLAVLRPGSSGYDNVQRLIDTRNPHAVLTNPLRGAEAIAAGGKLFAGRCVECHGSGGSGGPRAPGFIDHEFRHGASDWALYRNIRRGIPGTLMAKSPYSFSETWQLVAYVRSLGARARDTSEAGRATLAAVEAESLARLTSATDSWLTYSGTYSGHRHSALTGITHDNVGGLTLRWMHQLPGNIAFAEATPLAWNGLLFTTLPYGSVLALDGATGRVRWRYRSPNDNGGDGVGFPNRGVALLGNRVFVGRPDAHVVALDASTGAVAWDVAAAPAGQHFISSAPLAYRDLVVIGAATKEGGRGFLVALDAQTGQERWRFQSIPGPGEPGNESWGDGSWKTGGAPTWMTGSYDAQRNVLYWGIGNPKPDYEPWRRKGDNLYSNSVVALDGTSGKLAWYFQFTPADDKDWDSNQVPILVDRDSTTHLLFANRNGFLYDLERVSGKYLFAHNFVEQNWTAGIDQSGRPLPSRTVLTPEGTRIFPGTTGGTNWWPPTYDPGTRLLIVPVLEQGMIYFSTKGSWPQPTGDPYYTALRALNTTTGELQWEHRFAPRTGMAMMGGLLSTDGGVTFAGDGQVFLALQTATGKVLWSVNTGGTIVAAPMTYQAGGEQLVAVHSGHDLMVFGLPARP